MRITDRVKVAWDVLRQKRSWSPSDDRFYIGWPSGPTKAGVSVDEETSLRVIAVYACVNLLSSTIASLPLPVYKTLSRGKERAVNHPLYPVLHDNPNPEQTSFTWRQTSMAHALLWGNLYSEIEFNSRGVPVALWPLPPWRVQPKRTALNKQLYWEVHLQNEGPKYIPDYAMYHVMALGTNGITGLSPIRQAIEAVGLTMAAEEFGARLFGHGANMGGVVEHPKVLSETGHKNLEDSLNKNYTGLGKSHRIMLLEEGMKWAKSGVAPEEAQFLETRKFQIGEIARLYNVPPHMIQELSHATFSNIEHQGIDFVVNTLRPWLVNLEQEKKRKLFKGDPEHFAEYMVDGLLRGDAQSRFAAYSTARQWGWMSANDIRELENQNPLPGEEGNIYLVPMNMVAASGFRSEPQEEAKETRALKEERAKKATARFALAKSYAPMFNDMALRVIRAERRNVMAAAKKQLASRGVTEFNDWLNEYYQEQHPEFMKKNMEPIVRSLVEATQAAAANEIDKEPEMTPELHRFVDEYSEAAVARYIKSSKGQINSVVRDAIEEGADIIEALDARFDEWEEKRPRKVSDRETVQGSNAVAKIVFASAGYALMWSATGSDPCPFCEELDGRIIGREGNFVDKGVGLDAGQDAPLVPSSNISHPPLHAGCECQIVPA